MVRGLGQKTYSERLQALGLWLEQRRLRGHLIETYKLLHGKENIDAQQFFQLALQSGRRGHSMKLFKQQCRLEMRKNFFSQRVVNSWNALPSSIVSAKSVNSLKTLLDHHWTDMSTQIGHQALLHPLLLSVSVKLAPVTWYEGYQMPKIISPYLLIL
jgi:hypothetical protein